MALLIEGKVNGFLKEEMSYLSIITVNLTQKNQLYVIFFHANLMVMQRSC